MAAEDELEDCASARSELGTLPCLFGALHAGDACALRGLLREDTALFQARDKQGTPCLHLAVAAGHGLCVLALLLEHRRAGRSVDELERGSSCLHLAACSGHVLAAEALLLARANPAVRSAEGCTAAELAAAHGHSRVLALVLLRTVLAVGDGGEHACADGDEGRCALSGVPLPPGGDDSMGIGPRMSARTASLFRRCEQEHAVGTTAQPDMNAPVDATTAARVEAGSSLARAPAAQLGGRGAAGAAAPMPLHPGAPARLPMLTPTPMQPAAPVQPPTQADSPRSTTRTPSPTTPPPRACEPTILRSSASGCHSSPVGATPLSQASPSSTGFGARGRLSAPFALSPRQACEPALSWTRMPPPSVQGMHEQVLVGGWTKVADAHEAEAGITASGSLENLRSMPEFRPPERRARRATADAPPALPASQLATPVPTPWSRRFLPGFGSRMEVGSPLPADLPTTREPSRTTSPRSQARFIRHPAYEAEPSSSAGMPEQPVSEPCEPMRALAAPSVLPITPPPPEEAAARGGAPGAVAVARLALLQAESPPSMAQPAASAALAAEHLFSMVNRGGDGNKRLPRCAESRWL
ncbi:hypothetical protein T492DRAFT_1076906 [Pavlovales sp. CCMP2436]|nr:hypothetical protein T492DRAFT_1076906 [Pavlovales sp. CCMP2436]